MSAERSFKIPKEIIDLQFQIAQLEKNGDIEGAKRLAKLLEIRFEKLIEEEDEP